MLLEAWHFLFHHRSFTFSMSNPRLFAMISTGTPLASKDCLFILIHTSNYLPTKTQRIIQNAKGMKEKRSESECDTLSSKEKFSVTVYISFEYRITDVRVDVCIEEIGYV